MAACADRYLQGLLDLFGKFDENADGVVEFNEFCELWTHLGGEPPVETTGQPDSGDVDPLFDEYDLNADGVLSARGMEPLQPRQHCLRISVC